MKHGTLSGRRSGCHCAGCKGAQGRYDSYRQRSVATGTWDGLQDATATREHIAALRASGASWESIENASGLGKSTLWKILSGKAKTVQAATAAAVASARIPQPLPTSLIDATGARRRVQGLMRAGWTTQQVADAAGIVPVVLRTIRGGQSFVRADTHAAIKAATATLLRRPEPSGPIAEATRKRAAAAGFYGIGAWDEIDNPDEQPIGAGQDARRTREYVVEEATRLASFGVTLERAAEQIDVKRDSLLNAYREVGQPLPLVWRSEDAA